MKDNDKKIEQVATASLVPYAKNAKKHDAAQVAAIAGSIREFGFNNPVLIDGDNGIIAGHGRVLAAHQLGLDRVPCLRLTHLTDTQKRAYILADNRLAELGGGWDAEMLAAELESLSAEGITMEEIGFDADALEELGAGLGDEGNPEADAEPQIDKAEELRAKWGVEPGQLWELGDHRLLCGDSTKKEDVERVMGGEAASAIVTDSPYGINRIGIENDEPERIEKLFDDCIANFPTSAAVVFNFQSPRLFPTWLRSLEKNGHKFERALWWRENAMAHPWRGFRMQGEIIIASSIGKPVWDETKSHPDTFEDANRHRDGHTTQKPVSLVAALIQHTTGTVYEPFSGSGTTLIACEQLGRKCRAIEISPAYVAVALQRWADATGKTPKLVA
jgi:DNA modification methylase